MPQRAPHKKPVYVNSYVRPGVPSCCRHSDARESQYGEPLGISIVNQRFRFQSPRKCKFPATSFSMMVFESPFDTNSFRNSTCGDDVIENYHKAEANERGNARRGHKRATSVFALILVVAFMISREQHQIDWLVKFASPLGYETHPIKAPPPPYAAANISAGVTSSIPDDQHDDDCQLRFDDQGHPINLCLAIVGDSTSRQIYIALVYFIHSFEYETNSNGQTLVNGKYPSHQAYKDAIVSFFNGSLSCDCHKPEGNYRTAKRLRAIWNNMYYYYARTTSNISSLNSRRSGGAGTTLTGDGENTLKGTSSSGGVISATFVQKFGPYQAQGHWDPP
jgi:hypothetical protein